jgi:hypothetical protein
MGNMFANFEALHEVESGSEIEIASHIDALKAVGGDEKQIAPNVIAIHAKNVGGAEVSVYGEPGAGAAADVEDIAG